MGGSDFYCSVRVLTYFIIFVHKWQNLTGIRCSLLPRHQWGADGFYGIRQVMIYGSSHYLSSTLFSFPGTSSKETSVCATPTKTSNRLAHSYYFVLAKSSKTELWSNTVNSRIHVRTPPYFVCIVSQISTPHRRPSRSHRIHGIYNHRSIQCFPRR